MVNFYKYLYYRHLKVSNLSKKARQSNQVAESALSMVCLPIYLILVGLLISTRLLSIIPIAYLTAIIILLFVAVYYFSKLMFIKNKNYIEIERHFDKTNKLKNGHFVAIYILLALFSIGFMITSGIYYNR